MLWYFLFVSDLEWKLIYVGSAEDETYDQVLESVFVGPVNVGYYVNNDYDDEQLREEPPQKVLIDKVQRNILADKPRVTKFPINFNPANNENGEQPCPSLEHHPTEINVKGDELPCSNQSSVECS
ncbi:UNVERIFIED_CONTAM: Histone chaperone ASF1B [Sesamum angustifolium]|uniref:Histone chaperone ASF1B n=1 Tax=Sesamum angustifolium TaxID=2727405 RepID=A0AAW2M608_9LAMI